jgi:hypothetical protein
MAVPIADVGRTGTKRNESQTGKALRRHKPLQEQKFSNYLSFGFPVTVCLGVFLAIYTIILICASPLLMQEAPHEVNMKRGTVLRPVVQNIKNHLHGPSYAAARKQQSDNASKLIVLAEKELIEKNRRRDEAANEVEVKPLPGKQTDRKGYILLGMHRSGTSMLGGLMVIGLGYNAGSPLIGGAFDNEKGFFELIPAVLQNDEFMNLQRVWWSANVINYNAEQALADKESGKAKFQQGARALAFLNNPDSAPWMQKDPRMCITLRTWLKLLNSEPAVVWTYRHPMEVAHSLIQREASFTLDHGLRLWIVYNMRGLQNSRDLCRVYSSNEAILADPLREVQRISDELTQKCGVPRPPRELTDDVVNKFIDTSLVHQGGKKKYGDGRAVIEKHGDDCPVYELETKSKVGSDQYEAELVLYRIAMKLYCDMKSGAAYKDDYDEWPE